jgi:hypothetical protein
MSAPSQLIAAAVVFAALALWAWREYVMYTKRGVRVDAEVVRMRRVMVRGRHGWKVMCHYAPPHGPIQMSEQSVWYSDWLRLAEGQVVRIVSNPKAPSRWVLESALGKLAMAPVGLGIMAAGCLVAALMSK